jgi:antitoxin MazE
MQVKLVQIGNSMGLRLPKSLIKQFSLDKGEIELSVEDDGIKIKSTASVPPLETWDLLFKNAMATNSNLDNDVFTGMANEADHNEWAW